MPDPARLAVFASGGGTNFQALLDAAADGTLPMTIALLVADRPEAGALDRAEAAGVPAALVNPSASDHADALTALLADHDIDLVALAGYLRRIPEAVVGAYRGRMLNVHPSLLPAFGGKGMYGARVHQAVIDYGVRWTGVTVHLVDAEYDTGPVVLQEPVRVHPDDTPQVLAARVLEVEHRLYPEALRLFAQGRVAVTGRTVRIAPPASD